MLQNGKVYSFDSVAPTVQGTNFKNLKVIGVVAFDIVLSFKDVVTENTAVRAVEPTVPADAKILTYYILEDVKKEKLVMADEWIVQSSIQEIGNSLNVDLQMRGIASGDITKLKNAIIAIGLGDKLIDTKEV